MNVEVGMMNMKKDMDILDMIDVVNDLREATEHIRDFLDVLRMGLENDESPTNESEISCIHVLRRYVEGIQSNELLRLSDALNSMSNNRSLSEGTAGRKEN